MRYALILVALASCGDPDAAVTDASGGHDGAADGDAAGSDAAFVPPPCSGSLSELLVTSGPAADSEEYVAASAEERSELAAAIWALSDNRDAAGAISRAGYSVCATDDVVVLAPVAQVGRARIALRPGSADAVVLEAPHPYFDTDTGIQAVDLFARLNARAVIVSGTHRCANSAPSGCDGTTSVCGGSQYPVSDMAHTTESAFHAAHEALAAAYLDAWFVSLHGKSGDGSHLSDGTREPAATDSRVARATRAAVAELSSETIRTCNQVGSVETTDSLCGTTNVQGRHLNQSAATCTTAALSSTDRFLHVEQSRNARDQPGAVAAILEYALTEASR